MPDNFIWTKHVRERAYQRGIRENDVWLALRSPDRSEKIELGKYKFYKKIDGRDVVLVAVPQGHQWVILTTWVRDRGEKRQYYATLSRGYSRDPLTKFILGLLKRLFGQR